MGTSSRRPVLEYARAAGIVALGTSLCLALRARLAGIDVAMLLLLCVVVVAARYRRGPALLASILSIAAFDFLFVPPYYTFNVHDTTYYLTFGVMLVVAVTMSRLTARIREQREAAAEREQRTAALYAMERDVAAALDPEAIRQAAAGHLGRIAGGRACIMLSDELGTAETPAWPTDPIFDDPAVRIAAAWAYSRDEPTGWGTPRGSEVGAMLAPLRTTTGRVGLVAILPDDPDRELPDQLRTTLLALIDLVASALERRLLAQQNERAHSEVEAERLRTALLSSLSHDLRTPLASIEGSTTSLLDESGSLPGDVRRELLESILEESRRMTRLVSNLLDMVRVETGTLAVQKSWQPLEETLGVALLRLEDRLRAHPVTTRIPTDLPLVPIDELLIEQVLLNLLENAVRYTPPATPIEITAWREDGAVLVEVADRGPGVPTGQEEAVFGRFHRATTDSADAGAGSGLGLTICRGIITAHGGHIWIERRGGGGAAVRFTLPLAGPPAAPLPAELVPR
jgi:two-component system, OmpR family, sensor histidine kinase KdpD